MNIPGMAVSHQIITHDCRLGRGDDGAFEEAVNRVRQVYRDLVKAGTELDTQFHVALIVQHARHRVDLTKPPPGPPNPPRPEKWNEGA